MRFFSDGIRTANCSIRHHTTEIWTLSASGSMEISCLPRLAKELDRLQLTMHGSARDIEKLNHKFVFCFCHELKNIQILLKFQLSLAPFLWFIQYFKEGLDLQSIVIRFFASNTIILKVDSEEHRNVFEEHDPLEIISGIFHTFTKLLF